MATLDEVTIPPALLAGGEAMLAEARTAIGAAFWQWYHLHFADKLVAVHVWIIPLKVVRVSDLDGVFTMLFGPDPTASTDTVDAQRVANVAASLARALAGSAPDALGLYLDTLPTNPLNQPEATRAAAVPAWGQLMAAGWRATGDGTASGSTVTPPSGAPAA